MNFLAHIFLSGPDPEIRFGNFIGDEIKGSKYSHFSDKIQLGVLLHRNIDHFTDSNPRTLRVLKLLYPKMGKVAGIALDIYNDHFLARNWKKYCDQDLLDFTNEFYLEIERYQNQMPPGLDRLYYFMRKDNWLYHYQSKSKLAITFSNMVKKYPFASKLRYGPECLVENYNELEAYFELFFTDLQEDTKIFLERNKL